MTKAVCETRIFGRHLVHLWWLWILGPKQRYAEIAQSRALSTVSKEVYRYTPTELFKYTGIHLRNCSSMFKYDEPSLRHIKLSCQTQHTVMLAFPSKELCVCALRILEALGSNVRIYWQMTSSDKFLKWEEPQGRWDRWRRPDQMSLPLVTS